MIASPNSLILVISLRKPRCFASLKKGNKELTEKKSGDNAMNSTSKFRKLAGISALAFAGLTAANAVNAANWRYAHEEYEGDVQDVYTYKFKEYIGETSDHPLQRFLCGELGGAVGI